MPRKKSKTAVLVGLLGIVVLTVGCGTQPKPVAPPPPPPPPPPPAAPACTLTAEPSTVEKGQSVTLSWTSQNSTDLDLQPGVGKVQAQGSSSVKPDDSTTYTMTATGPGGNITCTARVTVTVPPPPPPPPPPKGPSDEELFGQNVKDAFFDFDKSNIRPDASQVLTANADFLKTKPDIKFTIEGHCDERGSEEYNLALGDKRATSAKDFLTNLGVNAAAITTITYGKDPLPGLSLCTDKTEDCWQQNRRDHFVYGTQTKQ